MWPSGGDKRIASTATLSVAIIALTKRCAGPDLNGLGERRDI
mgnify:CR=1 FL=1